MQPSVAQDITKFDMPETERMLRFFACIVAEPPAQPKRTALEAATEALCNRLPSLRMDMREARSIARGIVEDNQPQRTLLDAEVVFAFRDAERMAILQAEPVEVL